jgi:hypothetical protein
MPNKRDPEKRQLRAWMYESDIELLRSKAMSLGIPVSELILKLTEELKLTNKRNSNG